MNKELLGTDAEEQDAEPYVECWKAEFTTCLESMREDVERLLLKSPLTPEEQASAQHHATVSCKTLAVEMWNAQIASLKKEIETEEEAEKKDTLEESLAIIQQRIVVLESDAKKMIALNIVIERKASVAKRRRVAVANEINNEAERQLKQDRLSTGGAPSTPLASVVASLSTFNSPQRFGSPGSQASGDLFSPAGSPAVAPTSKVAAFALPPQLSNDNTGGDKKEIISC